MSVVPEGLVRTLQALTPDTPFALFLRHAERAPIPPETPYADVDLTPAGLEAAHLLGQWLRSSLAWAAVSPYLRCRRTAEALGFAGEVDTRLGAPGPWVVDSDEGARLFAELGTEGVVRAQLSGGRWPFIRGPEDGSQVLLSAALERLEAGRGSGVCISHDTVLMPAISWLTGEPFSGAWLAPLDGFAIQRGPGRLRCLWRGEARELVPA